MLRAMPHDGNGMRVRTMVTKLTSLISGSCYGALLKVWRLSKRKENRLLNHIDMDSQFGFAIHTLFIRQCAETAKPCCLYSKAEQREPCMYNSVVLFVNKKR